MSYIFFQQKLLHGSQLGAVTFNSGKWTKTTLGGNDGGGDGNGDGGKKGNGGDGGSGGKDGGNGKDTLNVTWTLKS